MACHVALSRGFLATWIGPPKTSRATAQGRGCSLRGGSSSLPALSATRQPCSVELGSAFGARWAGAGDIAAAQSEAQQGDGGKTATARGAARSRAARKKSPSVPNPEAGTANTPSLPPPGPEPAAAPGGGMPLPQNGTLGSPEAASALAPSGGTAEAAAAAPAPLLSSEGLRSAGAPHGGAGTPVVGRGAPPPPGGNGSLDSPAGGRGLTAKRGPSDADKEGAEAAGVVVESMVAEVLKDGSVLWRAADAPGGTSSAARAPESAAVPANRETAAEPVSASERADVEPQTAPAAADVEGDEAAAPGVAAPPVTKSGSPTGIAPTHAKGSGPAFRGLRLVAQKIVPGGAWRADPVKGRGAAGGAESAPPGAVEAAAEQGGAQVAADLADADVAPPAAKRKVAKEERAQPHQPPPRQRLQEREEEEEERLRVAAAQRAAAAAVEREAMLAARRRAEEAATAAAAEREALLKLLEKHEYINSLMFSYPEEVRVNAPVRIFFHRAASQTLAGAAEVAAMGAFNGWRWEPFEARLAPAVDLPNDWWSFEIVPPPEAYKVEFVFHTPDRSLFENNSGENFYLATSGGLSEAGFDSLIAERAAAAAAAAARAAAEERRVAAEKAAEERRARCEALAAVRREKERAAAEQRREKQRALHEAEDRAAAQRAAADVRERSEATFANAAAEMRGVWSSEPATMAAGRPAVLRINRAWRPLAFRPRTFLHAGINGWRDGVSIVQEFRFETLEGGDWWSITLDIPEDAFMVNFVLADGPPGEATAYDNNGGSDYAALVGGRGRREELLKSLKADMFAELQARRREKEAVKQNAAKRRTEEKERMRERTKETFLAAQAHVLYTEPAPPTAGAPAALFYNQQGGPLADSPEVWLRASFNRWLHELGCLPPVKMEATPGRAHRAATLDIPKDAYVVDAVFSERGGEDGSVYDNRGGLDYHIPVEGATKKERPLHIVHMALEMAPIAKVGGLGDVVTALSRAVQDLGHLVEVIVPKYDCLRYNHILELTEEEGFSFGGTTIRVWSGIVEGLSTIFLEPENGMFWVGCIYGRKDDGSRFYFFCQAALEYLVHSKKSPDIIHSHDWSSAPVCWLMGQSPYAEALPAARSVFTIHNLEFGIGQIGRAMATAAFATTVSPTYAREIVGHGAIAPHVAKFHGIINGIDPDLWDPLGDPFIPVPYTREDAGEGKRASKLELQRRLGLREGDGTPLVGVVSRLTAQKGMHLIKHAVWKTLDRGGQMVLLGSAPDPRHQREFEGLAAELSRTHPDMARLWLSYDEPLSHLIYAACDMVLVPSLFEPCGLTQMIALRYGAVPVVRRTGGLNDTVFDINDDVERARAAGLEPNGFTFVGTDAPGLDYALDRAFNLWYDDKDAWRALTAAGMAQDWSWNRPALDYIELYYSAGKV